MRINFGKHKNKMIHELPTKYLIWLSQFDMRYGKIVMCEPVTKADSYVQDKKYAWVIAARNELKSRRICFYCGKIMPAIGTSRRNGAGHKDWSGRTLHKRCWKECIYLECM